MATVLLPTSTFSRKIILGEHGASEPVVPGRADWLSDALRIDRSDTGFSPALLATLRAGVLLDVPASLAARIARDGQRIGAVLHRNHIEILTRHMLSAAIMGGEAKKAMRKFYELYGLDDDDLDEQSLYREYGRFSKRFFEKIMSKSGTKSAGVVLQKSRISQGNAPALSLISNANLDALCSVFDGRLKRCRIRYKSRLEKQSHIYLWVRRGGRKLEAITRRFGTKRSGMYRALKAVRKRIRDDKRFARAILPLLDPAFVLPAPAPALHLCHTADRSTGSFPSGDQLLAYAITPKEREPVAAAVANECPQSHYTPS